MLSLILAVLLDANAITRPAVTEIKPFRLLVYQNTVDVPSFAFAADGLYEYLGTPDGLLRARRLRTANSLDPIGFAGEQINNLYVDPSTLYVQPGGQTRVTSPDRTLIRSFDHGQTFQPIDSNLRDCSSGPCEYLVGHDIDVPAYGAILTEQGGNLLATRNDGATWNILYGVPVAGQPAAQVCPLVFERVGQRVVMGGECPLDAGFLRWGDLTPDFLAWATIPQESFVADLGNRNVQFIREVQSGSIFAGVEGGLLKSTDGGRSFGWSLKYELDAVRYPYIRHFVQPAGFPSLIIIGGFDKVNSSAYLAYSNDEGVTWRDVSALVPQPDEGEEGGISMLAQDLDTRVIAIYRNGDLYQIAELEIGDEPRGRRRAVRR
ncbi:MAG: hypothetical protein JJE51_09075 [Thermoanaerobaculia bacterium]|nr:hypothetical protein [Thermoanaerobaculia bacterium]